jgi:hypothetical protein
MNKLFYEKRIGGWVAVIRDGDITVVSEKKATKRGACSDLAVKLFDLHYK